MFTIRAEKHFDAAHFLFGYEGKCSNIHGHRWTVAVEVSAENVQPEGQLRGMVDDFSNIKADLKKLVNRFDHTLIYETGSLKAKTIEALQEEDFAMNEVPFRPTAENFSKYFYDEMTACGHNVSRVEVYETPNNSATYSA